MQFFCDWTTHVASWLHSDIGETVVIRYEDLLERPEIHFAELVKHIGLPMNEAQLAKAIEFSSFDILQRQERQKGFVENQNATPFFRCGLRNQWRHHLSQREAGEIVAYHGKQMQALGYSI